MEISSFPSFKFSPLFRSLPGPSRLESFFSFFSLLAKFSKLDFLESNRTKGRKFDLKIAAPLSNPQFRRFLPLPREFDKRSNVYLSSLLSIVRIPALLPPATLHRLTIDVGVVNCHNSVCRRFFGRKPEIQPRISD